jgi:hypothetical protein
MQQAMQQFAQIETPSGTLVGLAMKVGIAAGSARRFVVGEPSIQRIDILAGHTLERVSEAEHHAESRRQATSMGSQPMRCATARHAGHIQAQPLQLLSWS